MIFTTDYPGERRVTIKAVGGRMTAKQAILKYFGAGSVRGGMTKKQMQLGISSGTYPLETIIVNRNGSQSDFEDDVKGAAEKLSKKHRALVWDASNHWGFVNHELSQFSDIIPF